MTATANRPRGGRFERRSDPALRERVEQALWLAEWCAEWGDYRRGLEHLDEAHELSGGATAARVAGKRRAWKRKAASQPGAPPSRGPRSAAELGLISSISG